MNSDDSTDRTNARARPESRQPAGHIGRRTFLKSAGAVGIGIGLGALGHAASTAPDGPLPTRILGRTKQKVSILGLGTAPVGEGPVDVQEGMKIFGEAIDRGVTYIDTARIYGNAEEILGHLIPKKRDKLFIVTKIPTNKEEWSEPKSWRAKLEEQLGRLDTEYIDLLLFHGLQWQAWTEHV